MTNNARSSPLKVLPLLVLLGGAPPTAQVKSPVIVFWTAYPYQLPHITHFTPNVGIGDDSEQSFSHDKLRASGIMPLKSVPGKIAARDLTAEALAQRWGEAHEQGYAGIAIDEFGSREGEINAKMIKALGIVRRDSAGLFIAVWHAGPLTGEFARAYGRNADLVMLETYVAGDAYLAWKFGPKLSCAWREGILGKTVFALGINDVDKRLGTTVQPWANTPRELQAQMRWIRSHAPEMPGIAFFASHASFDIQRRASEIAWSIFAGD